SVQRFLDVSQLVVIAAFLSWATLNESLARIAKLFKNHPALRIAVLIDGLGLLTLTLKYRLSYEFGNIDLGGVTIAVGELLFKFENAAVSTTGMAGPHALVEVD